MRFLFVFLFSTTLACNNYKWHPFSKKTTHLTALILARGGSKGIPLKNLAKIGNTTLLSRTLTTLLDAKIFQSIWVSTDHELIAEEAQSKGVNLHWRANYTATDEASSIIAVQEFVRNHPAVDVIALIQCTSPFLKIHYLRNASALIDRHQCVFSLTRSVKLRWLETRDGMRPLNFDPKKRIRRQDSDGNEWEENGMFYFAMRGFIERGYFQNSMCAFVEIAKEDSVDIDSPWDLHLANLIHNNPLKLGERNDDRL